MADKYQAYPAMSIQDHIPVLAEFDFGRNTPGPISAPFIPLPGQQWYGMGPPGFVYQYFLHTRQSDQVVGIFDKILNTQYPSTMPDALGNRFWAFDIRYSGTDFFPENLAFPSPAGWDSINYANTYYFDDWEHMALIAQGSIISPAPPPLPLPIQPNPFVDGSFIRFYSRYMGYYYIYPLYLHSWAAGNIYESTVYAWKAGNITIWVCWRAPVIQKVVGITNTIAALLLGAMSLCVRPPDIRRPQS